MTFSPVKKNEWKHVCQTQGAQLVLTDYLPGVRVGEHSHQFGLVGMPFFGDMSELDQGTTSFRCSSFDIGLQPVGRSHSNQIGKTGLRSIMILFDRRFPEQLGITPETLDHYCFFKNVQAVKLGIQLCMNVFSHRISQEEFCHLAQAIFESIALQRTIDDRKKPIWVMELMNRIENSLQAESPRSQVKQLAAIVGFHPDYVSRKFKQTVGVSLCQYRSRSRVCRAARLFANSEKSASEISAECGFSDQPHMTRLFKDMLGLTPVALREMSKTQF